jgi:hypothetical protein
VRSPLIATSATGAWGYRPLMMGDRQAARFGTLLADLHMLAVWSKQAPCDSRPAVPRASNGATGVVGRRPAAARGVSASRRSRIAEHRAAITRAAER